MIRQEKPCRICGATFERPRKISQAQWESRVACGVSCGQTKPLASRLAEHLAPGGPKGDCLEWQGAKSRDGYGVLIVQQDRSKRNVRAHRLAYALAHPDEDIAGLVIRHTCDNRCCCNSAHLLSGTHQDNMNDRTARGRNKPPKGQAHGNAKLSEDVVRVIRISELSSNEIAPLLGVSPSLVRFVRQGKIWRHVA